MHRSLLAPQCINESLEPATDAVKRKLRVCANIACRELFQPQRDWQKFCSTECHDDYHSMAHQIGTAALDAVYGLKIAKEGRNDQ
ncbi:MAG: hypothetical protein IT393_07115 [Nitrospirae bacterium]|nr:hypothetical protein [Nitrospirota bacterium]